MLAPFELLDSEFFYSKASGTYIYSARLCTFYMSQYCDWGLNLGLLWGVIRGKIWCHTFGKYILFYSVFSRLLFWVHLYERMWPERRWIWQWMKLCFITTILLSRQSTSFNIV